MSTGVDDAKDPVAVFSAMLEGAECKVTFKEAQAEFAKVYREPTAKADAG